jgi:hypothetical protein
MQRRHVLLGACATAGGLLFGRASIAQPLRPVRLMIVRRMVPIPSTDCLTRCIRGRIYDVSDLGGAALDTTILPLLQTRAPLCDTIERPWRDNQPGRSSIPAGSYRAMIRTRETKPWMVGKPNRAWRLELQGVEPRKNIQFHYGKDVSWSEGCFILGSLLATRGNLGDAAYCKLENGEAAVAALRAAVNAPGADPGDIRIGVTDDAGLFPNYRPAERCS